MKYKLTQEKFFIFLKRFFFALGVFSVGSSIVLWFKDSPFIIQEILFKLDALFIGLWAPTTFGLSNLFGSYVDKLNKRDK